MKFRRAKPEDTFKICFSINTAITKKFLEALIKEYSQYHILLVWDNVPFYRKKELHKMNGLIPIFLPPYSPQLNPVERFFEEIRKTTANRFFKNIDIQKEIIEKELVKWINDTKKTKKLYGYDWILKQWESV